MHISSPLWRGIAVFAYVVCITISFAHVSTSRIAWAAVTPSIHLLLACIPSAGLGWCGDRIRPYEPHSLVTDTFACVSLALCVLSPIVTIDIAQIHMCNLIVCVAVALTSIVTPMDERTVELYMRPVRSQDGDETTI